MAAADPKPSRLADLIVLAGGKDVRVRQSGNEVHVVYRRDSDQEDSDPAFAGIPPQPYRVWRDLFEVEFGVITISRHDEEAILADGLALEVGEDGAVPVMSADKAMLYWGNSLIETRRSAGE